ncbi:hypothetical protein BB558_003596 [Smittium angustum]|uniref:Ankyrin repeat protein n=1 Tax=Smittium angustum TaxID=133377 RepID=A0A2U1J5K5_SMIAN|nr:hypothetical protein BB558_006714 [Smittium angustum]PWA00351.1 hypothetical protein BB558_003596 [Smittium angustum]
MELENISEEIVLTLFKKKPFIKRINLDKEPQIFQFLTTTKANLKDKTQMRKIFKSAFILDSVDTLKYLSENEAEISIIEDRDIESAIESDSINSLMYYVENVGLENINEEMKLSFLKNKKFAERFNLDKEPHICKFLTTTNSNLKDKKQAKKLLKIALCCDSVDTLKYLVGKGAKLSSFTCEDIEKTVEYNGVNCLVYYVEVLGIENIKKSTVLALIKSKNIAFKNKLLDLGLDPHIDKNYLLHSSLNGYDSLIESDTLDEILNFIKRLLDAGCDLYARKCEILVCSIGLNQPKIVDLILGYSKKPYPKIGNRVQELIFGNKVDLVRVILSHCKGVCENLNYFFYLNRRLIKTEMTKLLLEFGICTSGKHGMDMVKYAINNKEIELADLLMKFNNNLDYTDVKLFRDAVYIGCTSVTEKYLQNQKFINDNLENEFINLCSKNQNSFIEMTIKCYTSSKKLQKKNSSRLKVSSLVNIKDQKLLEIAIKNENMEMINTLLEYGAIPLPEDKNLFLYSIKHENIDLMNHYLQVLSLNSKAHRDIICEGLAQAIQYTCFNIYDSLITFLSEESPTKRKKFERKKTTGEGKPKAVEVSENIKNISQNIKNDILQQACNVGNVEYARKAIGMGADVNGIEPRTLCNAYVSKNTDILDLLIENGIEKERIKEYEFVKVCTEGNFVKVKEMVSEGIDLNIYDGMQRINTRKDNLECQLNIFFYLYLHDCFSRFAIWKRMVDGDMEMFSRVWKTNLHSQPESKDEL